MVNVFRFYEPESLNPHKKSTRYCTLDSPKLKNSNLLRVDCLSLSGKHFIFLRTKLFFKLLKSLLKLKPQTNRVIIMLFIISKLYFCICQLTAISCRTMTK